MEKIYDINYNRLVGWLTPDDNRKPKLLSLLGVLVQPVTTIYQAFLLYRKAKLYYLLISPQKCYLERLLNDRYDYSLRRIYIDDGIDKDPKYIYQHAELKPLYIRRRSEASPVFIYTGGESGGYRNDFIVYVPMGLVFQEPEMISLVKLYKLAGTRFTIQRF